jgi:hypothetical protein
MFLENQVGSMKEPESHSQGSEVKLPINKHVPITKHFSKFSSFLNQIEQFLCHWINKLKGHKCSLRVKSKKITQKTHEEEE